jgi:hypothetical protein
MTTLCAALLCILALGGETSKQVPSEPPDRRFRVEAPRPTIYLEVERNDHEQVWFRLHNNTRFSLAVRTVSFYRNRGGKVGLGDGNLTSVLPADVEIRTLHYYVEKDDPSSKHVSAPEVGYPDSYFVSWIPAGNSILFAVPSSRLRPGLSVYVPFQYEWELSEQLIFNGEPEHRVYFRGVDLSPGAT